MITLCCQNFLGAELVDRYPIATLSALKVVTKVKHMTGLTRHLQSRPFDLNWSPIPIFPRVDMNAPSQDTVEFSSPVAGKTS
jgi:hypothetical protein